MKNRVVVVRVEPIFSNRFGKTPEKEFLFRSFLSARSFAERMIRNGFLVEIINQENEMVYYGPF